MDYENSRIDTEIVTTYFPASVELAATANCNLRCKYCFESDKKTRKIDIDKFLEIFPKMSIPNNLTFFGGEPLLEIDSIIKFIDFINNSEEIPNHKKQNLIGSATGVITNGTLIAENIEKIKKYGFSFQLSLDGDKEAHDRNRCYANGNGSFDKMMEAIDLCVKNKISISFHGVFTKTNIDRLSYTFPFIFELYKKVFKEFGKESPIDETLRIMKDNNWLQINFEPEWTDDDIDTIINEFHKIADWIYNNDELSDSQKNRFLECITDGGRNKGGVCGAGAGFMTMDTNFDMYPCHRFVFQGKDLNSKFNLGKFYNILESEKRHWNSLFRVSQTSKYIYGMYFDRVGNEENQMIWSAWCPCANYETSGNLYYQPVKYSTMIFEMNRFLKVLKEAYFIPEEKECTCECGGENKCSCAEDK